MPRIYGSCSSYVSDTTIGQVCLQGYEELAVFSVEESRWRHNQLRIWGFDKFSAVELLSLLFRNYRYWEFT